MFEYIHGKIEELQTDCVIIDVHGIGYEIHVPRSTLENLPSTGESVKIFVHYYVREDMQKLYGFLTKSEREVFRQIIGISKIGPKVALNVLSGVSIQNISRSVQTGDISLFQSVSGIGAKTAQRLLVELKGKTDKIKPEVILKGRKKGVQVQSASRTIRQDAFDALLTLGYNEPQVITALNKVEETIGENESIENWIKQALRAIN